MMTNDDIRGLEGGCIQDAPARCPGPDPVMAAKPGQNCYIIITYLDAVAAGVAPWRSHAASSPATREDPRNREETGPMTKSELILRLSEQNPHLYQRDIEKIVTTIFDEISEALSRGDRVELRGFGAFSVKKRDARVGRNPRTGASVHVTQKFIPFFKTGKQLRERLNTE